MPCDKKNTHVFSSSALIETSISSHPSIGLEEVLVLIKTKSAGPGPNIPFVH